MLAAAGLFVVLGSCRAVMRPYAGEIADGAEYTVSDAEQCRRLLMEAVSSVSGMERHEFYVTGEDYVPETLFIAQMFPDAVNISNTKIQTYTEGGKQYVTCRIGFERQPGTEGCSHRWETAVLEAGSCLWGGKVKRTCRLCGTEEVFSEVPPGHTDMDGDSYCDRCRDRLTGEEEIERRFWSVGDALTRELGGSVYRFRCVDDDYAGTNSEYQKCALFLCENVIRSDVDSTDSKREILTFGGTNNYKTSEVRKWLAGCGDTGEMTPVNTGVNSAFLGKTAAGACGTDAETVLTKRTLPVQVMTDKLFLLSMEEALKYREFLWEAEGAGTSYSRGYWLRTPVWVAGDDGKFTYGTWEYAVDLENRCFSPFEVTDSRIGFRPAFCLPQA